MYCTNIVPDISPISTSRLNINLLSLSAIGVSVEDRVDAYECRSNLLEVLDTMGVSKSYSPLQAREYPIHPSPRKTVTTRIWRSSPAPSKVCFDI